MQTLLATKLHIPRLHANIIPRPHLIHKLNRGIRRKLTLIAAPAGYGKTTLLSSWLALCQLPVAYISLQRDDDTLVRFLSYLIAALKNVHPAMDDKIEPPLSISQASSSEPILTALLNMLTTIPDDFVLVLDNYHVINEPQIQQAMCFLLNHLPLSMHVIIASRTEPPLNLTHLRGQGQLNEIGAGDLRFTHEEVVNFNHVMKLGLSTANIVTLEERVEGWITGLHLAARSMQEHSDISAFINNFSGNNHLVQTYLSEEVFSHQPEHIQTFLVQTSLLNRLNGSLCDTVSRRNDGQHMLEMLAQKCLFIVTVDDEKRWYRYQPLFAEMLYAHLSHTHTSLLPELHMRASQWYERHEMFVEALEHALAAEHFAQIIQLVERTADLIWMQGDLPILLKCLQALPNDLIHTRPKLCLLYAWVLYVFTHTDMAVAYLQIAECTLHSGTKYNTQISSPGDGGKPDRLGNTIESSTTEIQNMLAIIHASSAIMQGDATHTIELARDVLEQLPRDAALWRGLITLGLGFAYQSKGNVVAASRAINEANKISQHAGNGYTRIFALSTLAQLQVEQGQLAKALRTYQQAIQAAQVRPRQYATIVGWAYIGIGEVLCEWNKLDEAVSSVKEGINRGEQGGNISIAANGYTTLARIKLAQDDINSALDSIQKAEQIARLCTIPLIIEHVAAMQALIWIARGNIEVAVHWTREANLSVNDELSYAYEFEYIALARVLLATGQYETALLFLQRLQIAAEKGGRTKKIIEILLLQALTYTYRQNETAQAMISLERALRLAQPEGYIRLFIDEGAPMASLLSAFHTFQTQQNTFPSHKAVLEYVEKLLQLFEDQAANNDTVTARDLKHPTKKESLSEPFSEREIEILQLINNGLSNRDIAKRIVITVGTVKWHLSNIYSKLDVHSRTQALARAREMDLLS